MDRKSVGAGKGDFWEMRTNDLSRLMSPTSHKGWLL